VENNTDFQKKFFSSTGVAESLPRHFIPDQRQTSAVGEIGFWCYEARLNFYTLEVFVNTSILRTVGEKSENIHKLKLTDVRKYDFRGTTELCLYIYIYIYFVDRACRYEFLLIINLTHFFMYLFISSLYMFWASQCSSSGDRIVL